MTKANEFLNGFKKGIKNFGHSISSVINFILLSAVYFIGVGITSIIAKISGKHFLSVKFSKNTYWLDFNLKRKPLKEYYRMF